MKQSRILQIEELLKDGWEHDIYDNFKILKDKAQNLENTLKEVMINPW
jgi:hypothetical protein